MSASEPGSGVATGLKVTLPTSANAAVHDGHERNWMDSLPLKSSSISNELFPGDSSAIQMKKSFGFGELEISSEKSSEFQVTVTARSAVGNDTSGAVGRGATQVPVHVKVAVYESAWAFGAAKHKAKIKQSTAPTVLNRLRI
jgi:hypothetical protein